MQGVGGDEGGRVGPTDCNRVLAGDEWIGHNRI